ncbi:MAG: primosomal protein N' [endosymbiont of Escarpia spicata]|uniref:Replication restart protein PriA n=1 Tax=endosymbiont of Escarpia spicata TaxID=2200908 RepID=A0A370DE72_9GAMM|nr:MAG: primosomal protein N' [endosymbiont of Escarpia spicata]
MTSHRFLRVALPGPLRTLFDYLPTVEIATDLTPGIRLKVPFGRGSRCGILWDTPSHSEVASDRLKEIETVIDQEALLRAGDISLLHWSADYYQHPLGDVLFHALPVKLRKCALPTGSGSKGWRQTQAGRAVEPTSLKRAPRQRSLMQALSVTREGLTTSHLVQQCGDCSAVLRTLRQKGWIEPVLLETRTADQLDTVTPTSLTLTETQKTVAGEVVSHFGGFAPFLLEGVTGSGKTEVYLSLIEMALQRGEQALVLVPEIGLTPQLIRRFERRLGGNVSLLHSGLADGERERNWLSVRDGTARVLVGTRSAVFTPMPELGLIIVDEEHDISFKQQEGFRYSARDLAVVRASRAGCPVLLGSATPSLESLRNVALQRYRHIALPERVGGARLPKMDLLDIRNIRLDGGLSPALLKNIGKTLQRGEQAMLFLNRRGFAPVITCHACGWLSDCPRCDARMTLHLNGKLLWCHHCGFQRRQPTQCPECGSPELRPLGQGTERLETSLQQHFPDTPIARIDRDSTRRKGSLEQLLKGIRAGHFPLLIGTQMLAKGHHFPDVTLVGIIDIDQGLFGTDYRASERMAQLLMQVAGRAGRADKPGRVLIQTRHPDHPLLHTLINRGYGAFAQEALAERLLAELPPFSYQVLLRAEATEKTDPNDFLQMAATAGQQIPGADKLSFWGPVPAPMERRAGKVRAHLLIQANDRGNLQQWLRLWIAQLERLPNARKVRWSVDVDPQEMF